MGELATLVAELRRRRVFRALVGWGVVAFAALQVAEPVLHAYHLPDSLLTWVVSGLALGFPVTAGLSWVFDLTRRGVTRTPPSTVDGAAVPGPDRRTVASALLGLGFLAAAPGLLYFFVWPGAARRAAAAPSVSSSVAVLPFADMSPQHDQEYFADGMAEEILNVLAHVDGLRVVGRTSSFSFKGRNEDLRVIGSKLDVGAVLEGSVRKQGDRVRVTAQLVRTSDGGHVWSETFERDLRDVFAVQDDVARAVVAALRVALLPGRAAPGPPRGTTPEAYDAYLEGLHLARATQIPEAVAALERAVAIDPGYAPAWALLSQEMFWQVALRDATGAMPTLERAEAAADKAVALAPESADGYLARGLLRSSMRFDWAGAKADFERALALAPGNALVQRRYGVLLSDLGRLAEGIPYLETAVRLDPLDVGSWNALGSEYVDLDRREDARRALDRCLAIGPTNVLALQNLGDLLLYEGKPEEAAAVYERITSEPYRLQGRVMTLHAQGREAEARAALHTLEQAHGDTSPGIVADAHGWLGDADAAFHWLDRAVEAHDTNLREAKIDRYLRPIRGDPRYRALLVRLNLPPD